MRAGAVSRYITELASDDDRGDPDYREGKEGCCREDRHGQDSVAEPAFTRFSQECFLELINATTDVASSVVLQS
jgi:hypothetical protein